MPFEIEMVSPGMPITRLTKSFPPESTGGRKDRNVAFTGRAKAVCDFVDQQDVANLQRRNHRDRGNVERSNDEGDQEERDETRERSNASRYARAIAARPACRKV